MRDFAKTAIGAVERSQVKVGHGGSNFPGEMIAGQFLVKVAPAFRLFRPGGSANRVNVLASGNRSLIIWVASCVGGAE
jgi:hypothetical protein